MDILIGAALAVGLFLLARQGGLLSGFGLGAPTSTAAGTPAGAPGTVIATQGEIPAELGQAAQAASSWASQIQMSSQQGSMAGFSGIIGSASAAGNAGVGIATGAVSLTTGSITAGIGIAVGIASMLWQQHELRMKDAKAENDAWNVIYPDWADAIQQIIATFNSGQINVGTTVGELDSLRALVYQDAQKFQNEPGVSWSGGITGGMAVGLTNSQRIWQVQCNKSCTIGCCLFNGIIGPNTERAKALVQGQSVAVFATGQMQMISTKSFAVPAIPVNSTYGFSGAPSFVLSVA